jgi:hypothetical protein
MTLVSDSARRLYNDDIQRTFTNIGNRPVACIVDYLGTIKVRCHIFSLPFKFDRLAHITNNFPNIVFNYVTHLMVQDNVSFKHEFFIRVSRSFPLLKYFTVGNLRPPFWRFYIPQPVDNDWCSIVEYPHLISLEITFVNTHYVEHFLNEIKTYRPNLTELKTLHPELTTVTENFTRDATRRNCVNVKRLTVEDSIVYSQDVYRYFPSLSVECYSDII